MKKVEEKIVMSINAKPVETWELISAVKGVDQWFPSLITSCRVEGNKRYCETTEGAKLREDIIDINHNTKTFKFSITEQDLLPVSNIVEEIIVREDEKGNAKIEWSASFDTEEQNEKMARGAFQNLWQMGLSEMESYLQNKKENEKTVV